MRTVRRFARPVTLVAAGAIIACGDSARGPTDPLLAGATPLFAAVTSTTSQRVPLNLVIANPCLGEPVQLTGNLHLLFHITITDNGTIHVKQQANPQGVPGTGLVSGAKYQGTGVTESVLNLIGPPPVTTTFVNNFRIIGQGPANNYLVHTNTHLTINANGEPTAEVINASVECR
jgi:hypothetical protein